MNIALLSFKGNSVNTYYSTQLAQSLVKQNGIDKVQILLPAYSTISPNTCGKNVNVATFPYPRNLAASMLKSADPFFYRYLFHKITSLSPDIVHITFEFRFPLPLLWALQREFLIVSTIHEPVVFPADVILRRVLLDPIQNLSTRLLSKRSVEVIVHGHKHEEFLISQGIPDHKVHVIPHGSFSVFGQQQYVSNDIGKPMVLFFGKIVSHYKGIEYLIRSAPLIERQFPDVRIVIAGEGDFSKYAPLVKGNDHFVIKNRFIAEDEVAELFKEASVVVLPYTAGSQSGIITIAGLFKKPVVVTDVGHFREMVRDGKTGLIVPPRDAQTLAEAIAYLLANNEVRVNMGENAYKVVNDEYSWDSVAEKTVKVYEKAMKQHPNSK